MSEFAEPMSQVAGDFFDGFYEVLLDLDWDQYRSKALLQDPKAEESRVLDGLKKVEAIFGFQLQGEILIMGAFEAMDGYARFDRGTHRVYLGVDESHHLGKYLDVLIAHELTHVARESRPEVWEGFGLNPKMTNDEFTGNQPVIEHLVGEGFSCAISEILVPGEPPWTYAYQTKESLAEVLRNSHKIDHAIKAELSRTNGDYGRLYRLQPVFAHYVWAWQWVKKLIEEQAGGDPRRFVSKCSKDWVESALQFELNQSFELRI